MDDAQAASHGTSQAKKESAHHVREMREGERHLEKA